MKQPIFFILIGLGLALYSCGEGASRTEKSTEIAIVDFKGIKPLLNQQNDTTYVINFWATWCAPCVKEIPHFEQLGQEFSGKKIKIILVNLDFPNHYKSRLLPFLKEKNIKSMVVMLDDPNANFWINEVSTKWSGSIPATLIYNRNSREFYEKEFSYNELKEAVLNFL
jgi:thiol-disulfide isomerase/thioredoxin